MSMSTVVATVSGIFLLLAVYCAVDPFNHAGMSGFQDYKMLIAKMPDWSEVPKESDSENLLQKSEIKFLNEVQGPESLAFDAMGRGPYTGVADGRVLFWDGEKWSVFAYTSANRSEGLCDPKPSIFHYVKNEHICGRPLGLRFDKRNGDLYIADAYFGLMKVGPEGGLATSLTTEAERIPIGFTNDLDIDEHGNIYFTDSSTIYKRRNFLQLVFTADDSGRLLKYNPATKETVVLVRNLQFPNGVSLSKDGSFLVYCEGSRGRLSKYWLKGDKAGTSEPMAILPGFPDNIRTNENGDFWVAIHCRRTWSAHFLAEHPNIRKLWMKTPLTPKLHYLIHIGGTVHGVIVKYSPEGKILRILEDKPGKVVRAVSEVEERNGKLWIGSVLTQFIAVYELE